MNNKLSKEFNFKELLLFALPSTIMMIFLSLYSIVDGFFVSRFVGTDALSALNITYPLSSILIAISVMFATGGSALVSRQMGQGKNEKSNKSFTLIVISTVLICLIFAILSLIFIKPLLILLGANELLLPLAKEYLTILLIFSPLCVMQLLFQNFLVTAGKPNLGLILTVAAGICNIILDYIFIIPLDMGISGAALATGIGYCIPAFGGLVFFFKNKNGLRFKKPSLDLQLISKACLNGSSEMVTNLAVSVTTLLFNVIMIKLAGSDGVAAITVILYVQFLMTSLFMGFSMGIAPIVSYHYGAKNKPYLKRVIKMSSAFIVITSVVVFIFSINSGDLIALLFTSKGSSVYPMIIDGLDIFSISLLFAGVNIFSSALFTALSDGKRSAIISFGRTFLFTIVSILVMSRLFGVDGVWLSLPIAEGLTLSLVWYYSRSLKTKYKIF